IAGVFNVSSRNFTLEELGLVVAEGLNRFGIQVTIRTENRPDVRSYRVATDKASSVLKFAPRKGMAQTVDEVIQKSMAQSVDELEHPRYYNILQMERLMAEGVLGGDGRHTRHAARPSEAVAVGVGALT